MSAQTNIEWCDSTVNFWYGCTGVSPACDNCYAEARMDKRLHRVEWGAGKPRQRTNKKYWRDAHKMANEPFHECAACGWRGAATMAAPCPSCKAFALNRVRRRIFSLSLGDWLDNEVPIEWLVDALDVILTTPGSDWLLLTKRIGNWQSRLRAASTYAHVWNRKELYDWIDDWLDHSTPPSNVWIGATVVNQAEADRDIPKLLRVPARIRFLSVEPMLGEIDLQKIGGDRFRHGAVNSLTGQPWVFLGPDEDGRAMWELGRAPYGSERLHWVIAGGESGPHARPMHPDWVRSLRDQCASAGVPFLFKQWGHWLPHCSWTTVDTSVGKIAQPPMKSWAVLCPDGSLDVPDGYFPEEEHGLYAVAPVGAKRAGRRLDGREWDEFPKVAA